MIRLLVVLAALLAATPAQAQQCVCPDREATVNCGHRGTGNSNDVNPYAENTIASFLQAELEGATMIELDAQPTSDGALIVFHDDELDELTDGTGCVAETTLAEIDALHVNGEPIPTLAEALDAISVDVNVEVKAGGQTGCPDPDEEELGALVFETIEEAAPADREVIVTSFDADLLDAVRDISIEIYRGRIAYSSAVAEDAADAGMHAVISRWDQLSSEDLEATWALGLDQGVYTVNDDLALQVAVDLGVDIVITDEPDRLEAIFAERCADFVPDPECDEGDDDDAADDDDAGDDDDGGSGCTCASSVATGGAGVGLALVPLAAVRRRRTATR